MTQMISKTQAPVKRAGRIDPIAFFERFGVLIFMILLLIFFQSQNSNFFSERNIFNILTEVSIYGIMAVGMTFVILTAGIDLSVGSILAVCAMTAAYVIKGDNFTTVDPNAWGGMSWLIGLGICLAMGTAIGFLHGLGVTRLRLPPFIVTLGGMTIWRGLTLVINDGAPIAGFENPLGPLRLRHRRQPGGGAPGGGQRQARAGQRLRADWLSGGAGGLHSERASGERRGGGRDLL
ncbi:MAG: sugar transporter permease [Enterobacter mori]|nr:sugar transporter permease [Enterobacter mori]